MLRGGVLIGQGADTCVYSPKIDCVPGTQTPDTIPDGDYISRVTNKKTIDGEEVVNQAEVKQAIHRIQENYPDKEIEKFFNVAVATCTPLFKDSDTVRPCAANNNKIDTSGQKDDKVNFITLRQNEDVRESNRSNSETLPQLRKLFHAVAYLNNENVIHTDAHFGNIAWMGDRIVMHDWGRAAIGIKGFKDFVDGWGLLNPKKRKKNKEFVQFKGPCEIMETCPINLDDDMTSHRFMKFYDVASLAAGGEKYGLLSPDVVRTFASSMEKLWKDTTIPIDDMMPKIHESIDVMFDNNQLATSSRVRWEEWMALKKTKKVSLKLMDKPGVETKINAQVVASLGIWAVFMIDDTTKRILEQSGYPFLTTISNLNPPVVVMYFPSNLNRGDPSKVIPKLFIPIEFLYKNKVTVEELPVSDLSLSPDSIPSPPAIKRVAGARKLSQTNRFCKCIKKVRKTFRNEKGPIAVCVKSVLWKQGRTLRRFKCGRNARVITQKRK